MQVKILRTMAAHDCYILSTVLPFSGESDTGHFVLMLGMGLKVEPVPLHSVYIDCGLVQGEVAMAVRQELPIKAVDVILRNGLAGRRVWADWAMMTLLEEVDRVLFRNMDESAQSFPEVFTACAVTRAMTRVGPDREQKEGVSEVQPVTIHYCLSLVLI